MPRKPWRPCRFRGCGALTGTATGYCARHEKQAAQEADARRGSATERGYDGTWARVRVMKLGKDPLCERCLKAGLTVGAVLVHHQDRNPRNNAAENIEALCVECHDAEHRRERWR